MDRKPSTTLAPFMPCGILPPTGARRETFQAVTAAARAAFPGVDGLVYVDACRAFFQKAGDATFYSVAISSSEAETLGYLPALAR